MTYVPKASSTQPLEGIDLNAVYTAATATATGYDPAYPAPPFLVGTETIGNNDSRFVFVTVSTSCNKGDFVVAATGITSFTVVQLQTSIAAGVFGQQIGVAMATGTTGQFLWMQTEGENQAANVTAATTAGVPLFTSGTAGALTSVEATGTNFPVYGVALFTTATAAQTAATANLTNVAVGLVTSTAANVGIAF